MGFGLPGHQPRRRGLEPAWPGSHWWKYFLSGASVPSPERKAAACDPSPVCPGPACLPSMPSLRGCPWPTGSLLLPRTLGDNWPSVVPLAMPWHAHSPMKRGFMKCPSDLSSGEQNMFLRGKKVNSVDFQEARPGLPLCLPNSPTHTSAAPAHGGPWLETPFWRLLGRGTSILPLPLGQLPLRPSGA